MSALSRTFVVSEASVWTCPALINVNVTAALGASHTVIQPVKVQTHCLLWLSQHYVCFTIICLHPCSVCMFVNICGDNANIGTWNFFSPIPDINECLNPDTCPNEQCENTPGSYECVPCLPGHEARAGTCYGESNPAAHLPFCLCAFVGYLHMFTFCSWGPKKSKIYQLVHSRIIHSDYQYWSSKNRLLHQDQLFYFVPTVCWAILQWNYLNQPTVKGKLKKNVFKKVCQD